ncbi:MAG TPA: ABC transporter C-terminal domain-containing protein, partial [Syntrophobacteria bacterium]|nr:ABC transporter C-terminal domain-containing protein [Syntrophobacteria bacterium]
YLAKKASAEACESTEGNPPLPSALPPFPPSALPKAERLRSREADKQRQREAQRRTRRLAELESALEREEGLLAALETRMADPAFFADPEQARRGGDEHAALTARIALLYGEWEELSALTEAP